jgi:hypothetical protein
VAGRGFVYVTNSNKSKNAWSSLLIFVPAPSFILAQFSTAKYTYKI